MSWENGNADLSCAYADPSSGSNSFGCLEGSTRHTIDVLPPNGATLQVIVTLGVGEPSARSSPETRARRRGGRDERDAQRRVLRGRDLRGSGWRKTKDLDDLGWFGEVLEHGTLPAPCEEKGPRGASGAAGSLFVREAVHKAAGSAIQVHRSAARARAEKREALSRDSLDCLAALFTASPPNYQTRASVSPRSVSGATGRRVTIRGESEFGSWTGYLDVTGIRRGRRWALLAFFRTGKPFHAAAQRRVLRRVAKRLR